MMNRKLTDGKRKTGERTGENKKQRRIGCLTAVLLCLGMAGAAGADTQPAEKESEEGVMYRMEVSEETLSDLILSLSLPGLWLNAEEHTFSFGYDVLSSYLPVGSYTVEGDVLTAVTDDGNYRFCFRVLEDDAYAFLADESSEVRLTDSRFGVPVEDGAVFRRWDPEQNENGPVTAFELTPSQDGVEEFLERLGDKEAAIKEYDLYEDDTCYNVTPEEITEEYGFRIFKFDKSCCSLLLYGDEIYPLGVWFGGRGAVSFAVADENGDGEAELYFTFSWGSGMHHCGVGYFDTDTGNVTMLPLKSDRFGNFAHELALSADAGGSLCVYAADYGDTGSHSPGFVEGGLTVGKEVAKIGWDPETEEISLTEPDYEEETRETDISAEVLENAAPGTF